jgi:hypothetical protein
MAISISQLRKFEEVIQKDLQILTEIESLCERHIWVRSCLNILVSKYPWKDICSLLWITAAVGVYIHGVQYFLVVMGNLGISYG